MLITVFTPTYNRANRLGKLYNSLKRQIFSDFEWLIVDDGSSDETRDVVERFIKEGSLDIVYIFQENCGKHRAINRGTSVARGELFFIVDSDDYLPDISLSTIADYYSQIKDDKRFAGVCGLKCFEEGTPTGGYLPQDILDRSPLNRGYNGDMAEVFLTDILRAYPFPDFPGERFCPEVLVWHRIGKDYMLRYFNKNVYYCEYLSDGLSNAIVRNRVRSPRYASLASQEFLYYNVPLTKKCKESINFWRFYLYVRPFYVPKIPFFAWLFMPFGLGMMIKDQFTFNQDKKPQNKYNA